MSTANRTLVLLWPASVHRHDRACRGEGDKEFRGCSAGRADGQGKRGHGGVMYFSSEEITPA